MHNYRTEAQRKVGLQAGLESDAERSSAQG